MNVAPPLPGVSRRILVSDKHYRRYSEADVIELRDGRLLLAASRKSGGSDFAGGEIIGAVSCDGGITWEDQPRVIIGPGFEDVTNPMSASLFRTTRGVHLLFLARGPDAKRDTRVYQMISADEGASWSAPQRVSRRAGYHIVNNARVIRTRGGRVIVPCAFIPGEVGSISDHYDRQRAYCLLSDDDAATWRDAGEVVLEDGPLMEPGVAECADGTLYMTLRTKLGRLYEARSTDGGMTWSAPRASELRSPEAPSTVFRDPRSDDLWMFWIDRPAGTWKQRNPLVVAVSRDGGRTWAAPRPIEVDVRGSFGYVSVDEVNDQVLLTYYDWRDAGQPPFEQTSLRQRTIPYAWLRGQAVPPVFRARPEPVLKQTEPWEGRIVSMNSGLLPDRDRWRLWYTNGKLSPAGERLRVCYAESKDLGVTWSRPPLKAAVVPGTSVVLPKEADASAYHASVHRRRDAGDLVAYVWRRDARGKSNGLYRYVSSDDGESFTLDPDRPLFVSSGADADAKRLAGDGHVSNDAFHVVQNADGTWEYFAACLEKATDPRTVIAHDNAAGQLRLIGRATSADGVNWSPIEVILRPDYELGDPYDTQFYGLQVFRYGRWYLGLLQTFRAQSQVIQPEWAWSHDGQNWVRTRSGCIPLGDEGRFDSRMILFGQVVVMPEELAWMYSGYDWRHNAFRSREVSCAIGRATLPRAELETWLATLPQP